jgi:hypothetical protein
MNQVDRVAIIVDGVSIELAEGIEPDIVRIEKRQDTIEGAIEIQVELLGIDWSNKASARAIQVSGGSKLMPRGATANQPFIIDDTQHGRTPAHLVRPSTMTHGITPARIFDHSEADGKEGNV